MAGNCNSSICWGQATSALHISGLMSLVSALPECLHPHKPLSHFWSWCSDLLFPKVSVHTQTCVSLARTSAPWIRGLVRFPAPAQCLAHRRAKHVIINWNIPLVSIIKDWKGLMLSNYAGAVCMPQQSVRNMRKDDTFSYSPCRAKCLKFYTKAEDRA